jgi:hypothetical protein
MRRATALAALVLWLLSGCAARPARPPATASSEDTAATTEDAKRGRSSRWRKMTWAEYYSDVKERAWRRNADVIWIWPPRVERVPKTAAVTPYKPCAP